MHKQYWTTLISAHSLYERLHDPNLVVVDCRFELRNPEMGRTAYRNGHLPGAQYAHLNEDLSGPITATSGRHPLPSQAHLCAAFSRWGISADKQVVAYDADNGSMAAARLWWLLRWLGHKQVAVLDGGLKAWQAAGFALTNTHFSPSPTQFVAQYQPGMTIDAVELMTLLHKEHWLIVDARAPERYAGEVEPLDPVAGHIPGAINHPLARTLQPDGHFLPTAELHTQLQHMLGNIPPQHVIASCGSGVTACHTLLALEAAGLHGGKLYPGSWSEWCADPTHPIKLGNQP